MAAGQRLVAYERVSTARQGARRLGLEAQRKTIEDFAASRGAEVLAWGVGNVKGLLNRMLMPI